MKRLIILFFFTVFSLNLFAQFPELKTIEIGTLSTTHIIFSADLTYVDISRQDVIAAKVVEASKNMLAIKARKEFDYATTISALESNGTMHTFKVVYNSFPQRLVIDTREKESARREIQERDSVASFATVVVSSPADSSSKQEASLNITSQQASNFGKDDAPSLEDVRQMPQTLFHIGSRVYGLEAYITNLYVYSDMMYVVVTIHNKTDIGYEAGDAQFTIENIVRKKNQLATDKPVWAKASLGTLSCPPKGSTTVAYLIPKLTLLENECMRIYVYEKRGTRNMVLTLTDKDVNYAVAP